MLFLDGPLVGSNNIRLRYIINQHQSLTFSLVQLSLVLYIIIHYLRLVNKITMETIIQELKPLNILGLLISCLNKSSMVPEDRDEIMHIAIH